MLDTVFGLPVHPLVVHATVVLVPVAALMVAISAGVPRSRTRLAWPAFLLAVLATAATAAAALSGGPLARRVGGGALIAQHAALAKGLALWVVALTGAALAVAYTTWWRAGNPVPFGRSLLPLIAPDWLGRWCTRGWVMPVAAGLGLVTALGTVVQVVLVGHSGAEATWAPLAHLPARR